MRGIIRFVAIAAVGLGTAFAPLVAGSPQTAIAAQGDQLPGTTTLETVEVNGVTRYSLVYVPSTRPTNARAPLVISVHGGSIDMLYGIRGFGIREEAERAGFIALFPNGTAPGASCCNWNDGFFQWGEKQPPDDVKFISELLDVVTEKYQIDPDRIYATGISNGGGMSYRLACELSDRLAGIAAVAASRDSSGCTITHPLSIVAIHGTDDPLFAYAGGPNVRNVLAPASQNEIVEFWRTFDGCSAQAETRMLTPVVEERAFEACRGGTAVKLYTVQGGMHCWPGVELPPQFSNLCNPGGPHMSFKASTLIVDFFLSHPRQAGA
jgi:polyhydroxybutyrate depolymerase